MIIKYRKEKIYNPNDFKHQVRRASQVQIRRRYVPMPINSKAMNLLFIIPIIGIMLKYSLKLGQKIINKYEKKQIRNVRKELSNEFTIHN